MNQQLLKADRRLCVLRLLDRLLDGLAVALVVFGHRADDAVLRGDIVWLAANGRLYERSRAAQ